MRRCAMWFSLPNRYVSLKVASAFSGARCHIGKEVVDVRTLNDFTIWRVADVFLAPDSGEDVHVRYELVMGRGKDYVETFFSRDSWCGSRLCQFLTKSLPFSGSRRALIEALRSGE